MYPVEATIRTGRTAGAGVDDLTGSLLALAGTGDIEHVSVLNHGPQVLRAVLFVRAERALGAEQAARLALGQWCDRVTGAQVARCAALLDTAPRAVRRP